MRRQKIGGTQHSPKTDPEIFQQTHKWENKVFSAHGIQQLNIHMEEEQNSISCLTTYTKISMEWVINLNIKMRNLQLSEENTGDYLYDSKENKKNYVTKNSNYKTKKKPNTLDFIKIWNLEKNILKIFLKITLGKNIHKTYMSRELILRRYIFFPTTK